MGKRLNAGRMHGQIRIEKMGVMDAPGFGNKPQLCAAGVKTPGDSGVPQRQRGFVLPVEEPVAQISPAGSVGHVQHRVAVPLHGHNGDGPPRVNADHVAPDGNILKSNHAPPHGVAMRCTWPPPVL